MDGPRATAAGKAWSRSICACPSFFLVETAGQRAANGGHRASALAQGAPDQQQRDQGENVIGRAILIQGGAERETGEHHDGDDAFDRKVRPLAEAKELIARAVFL